MNYISFGFFFLIGAYLGLFVLWILNDKHFELDEFLAPLFWTVFILFTQWLTNFKG